jgi:hypothetical protein
MSSRNIKRVLLLLILLSVISGTLLYIKFQNRKSDALLPENATVSNGPSYFPELYLKPEQVKIEPNETAVVNVVLVNGSAVAALDIGIEYDGNVIEVLNVTSNYSINYSTGYILDHFLRDVLELEIYPERPIENGSIVASIAIRGVREGKSVLSFSIFSELYDEKGKPINRGLFDIAEVVVGNDQL